MHVYVATSLDLNWPLGLLGNSAEKKAHVSDHSNTDDMVSPLLIMLTIVIGLVLLHLHRGVENREPNFNTNEVDQDEPEHSTSKLDHYFDGDRQLRHNVACAFCGNLSTTRCSRCKVARYCSVGCQIRHWRSGHRYECFEADQAIHIHDHGTSMLVEKSDKISVQESIAEKRRLEEQIQMSECAKLKKELREEHKRAQSLTLESNKSNETAQIAIREVEVLRQELQEEREHVQRLRENFLRDVTVAKSRAAFAEEKLSDLHRKIRLTKYKACTICRTNEKDLAFGCGHMTCRDCGSKLSKCPICREHITSHIRLFPG